MCYTRGVKIVGLIPCLALLTTPLLAGCDSPSKVGCGERTGAVSPGSKDLDPTSQTASPAPEANPYVPYNFSWVVDESIAGMGYPGTGPTLEKSMQFLSESGVTLVVSLTEHPVDEAMVAAEGMDRIHIPVVDFTPPSQNQIATFVQAVKAETAGRGVVAVHCAGGKGRTGTMLAAWFVSQGMSSQAAIEHVRSLRPGSIETASQEQAIHAYAARPGRLQP